jgi:cell division septum initiation protein DivIVA
MKTIEVAAQVKKLANHYQAVIDLAALIEKVGSIEQAASEAEGRLHATRAELAKQQEVLADVRAEVVQESVKANEIAVGAQAEANRIVQAATAEADAFKAAAQTEAGTILGAARAAVDEAEANLERQRATLEELVAQIADKQGELERVNAILAEARAKLGA